ncbi:hypothetical protein CP082626L3_0972 [Chlamydia psittaci 08-2626_L3]|nr:hypothetical protein CP082626L3_0972 [Chlamydia psittaci 08-2626_L3]
MLTFLGKVKKIMTPQTKVARKLRHLSEEADLRIYNPMFQS